MAGGKGAHAGSRFIRRLRMKRALGIPSSHRMWPARQMHGQGRRPGDWWDRKLNCIAIEGVDFAQDTEEGGADRFELIPDSDEEGGVQGSSLVGDDDEYVPETEPQDVVTVSTSTGLCDSHGRLHLGTALREWRWLISDVENESGNVDMETAKVQMHTVKVEMESDNFVLSAKVQMDTVKLEKQSAKVEMDTVKLENETAKVDMDNGKEEQFHKDKGGGVQGSSLLGDDDEYVPEMEPHEVVIVSSTGLCDNHGRLHLGTVLREWRQLISDVENESGKVDMETAKVQMHTVKVDMETAKVRMDTVKLEKQNAKVEMDTVKVEMGNAKEEVFDKASFSDIEIDDETCWFQDSQVEDDDFNEQGLLIVFVI